MERKADFRLLMEYHSFLLASVSISTKLVTIFPSPYGVSFILT